MGFLIGLGVNFALPVLVYDQLKPAYGDVEALLASSLPPLAWSVFELERRRRIDALSMIALAGVVLSLLAIAGGGGVHLLQLREKLVTALIGLVFLGSALIGRPLIYQLAQASEARRSPQELVAFEALCEKPLFKRTMMIMTLDWGFGLVAEAMLAAALGAKHSRVTLAVFAIPCAGNRRASARGHRLRPAKFHSLEPHGFGSRIAV